MQLVLVVVVVVNGSSSGSHWGATFFPRERLKLVCNKSENNLKTVLLLIMPSWVVQTAWVGGRPSTTGLDMQEAVGHQAISAPDLLLSSRVLITYHYHNFYCFWLTNSLVFDGFMNRRASTWKTWILGWPWSGQKGNVYADRHLGVIN